MGDSHCCGGSKCCHHGASPFFGRLLISLIFIIGGVGKIIDFESTVELFKNMGIGGGNVYVIIGTILELGGGLLILLGYRTRLGVWALMIFLLPATLLFHAFWKFEGVEMTMMLSMFLKNLAIYGGLLLLHSFGPGTWSFDYLRCKGRDKA